jgi:hypothetical protein
MAGAPDITLVDVDGYGVGPGEKHIPEIPPDPDDHTRHGPAGTDVVRVRLGRRDFEHRIGGARRGAAPRAVRERADGCPDEPDDDEGAVFGPIPDGLGAALRDPHEWGDTTEFPPVVVDPPDPPDDGPGSASAGRMMAPAPLRGGAPDQADAPSPTEWAQACALVRGEPG